MVEGRSETSWTIPGHGTGGSAFDDESHLRRHAPDGEILHVEAEGVRREGPDDNFRAFEGSKRIDGIKRDAGTVGAERSNDLRKDA